MSNKSMAIFATGRISTSTQHEHQRGQRHATLDNNAQGLRVAPPRPDATPSQRPHEELPRAASYTYIPAAKERQYADFAVVNTKRVTDYSHGAQSDDEVVETSSPSPGESPPNTSGRNSPDHHTSHILPPQASDAAEQLQKSGAKVKASVIKSGRSSVSTVESSIRQSGTSLESNRTTSTAVTTPPTSKRPSLNKSLSQRLSGRSWYPSSGSTPSSRSPSPEKKDANTATIAEEPGKGKSDSAAESTDTSRRRSFMSRRKSTSKTAKEGKAKIDKQDGSTSDEESSAKSRISRKGTLLRKKATRAAGLSSVATNDGQRDSSLARDENIVLAVPALPRSFSSDRLPFLKSHSSQAELRAPVPKVPSEKHIISPLSVTAKKKDELWAQFRSLDADFTKFSSKSTALKANVVRSSLIPFLRDYAHHTSNRSLRPEDLDRRTSILNKWWVGLIEMLHGKHNQSISGTDRPVILDGIAGIMERTEWRLAPSPFCPLSERIKMSLGTGSRSNTSLGSSSSDFLADSVHHNVRNIFTSNLIAQMAFVVDKMSLRNASASLVTFCGKACAYAFMFVPGMADILIRLWELESDVLRRVLQENGIGKFDHISELTFADIVSNFPPALQSLGFSSLMKYVRKLKTPPALPLGTSHIEWWGHWVERWTGRESDLFYKFVSHYHVLATDFIPADATKEERMCAPGMLPVHAQILANLELTIHREANQAHDPTNGPTTATFDDLLGDPDAVASALPMPPTNAVRVMAENRLIMLIRDFLSERTSDHPIAREHFAQSFNGLLQAAARGTSLFNHPACYTLLDFLEEALVILIRYESLRPDNCALISSDFWQTVCRRMIESENTMTEIRLYAFLFTVWNAVSANSRRKGDFCMNLLLEPDLFESRFNHWCPMVRAYYMRLLCWRLGRHDEDAGEADLGTFETLQQRLQSIWSYYIYLCDKAEREQTLLPDTAPCHPAPGRRLLIVRTDNLLSPGGSFLTFDGLMKDAPMQFPKRTATAPEGLDSRPESSSSNMDSDSESQNKGLGGFLRKMIGGSSTKSKSKENIKPVRPLENASRQTRSAADTASETPAQKPTHRSLSFKFSLEFVSSNKPHAQMRLFAPRLPAPAQNLLEENGKLLSTKEAHRPVQPTGASVARARYAGRALAEWTVVVGECQSFFDRRLKEGVPSRKWVETPTLGVEVFKRPS